MNSARPGESRDPARPATRACRRARFWIPAFAAIGGFFAAIAPAAAQPLEDARWARPGADLVSLLTISPGECLRVPNDAETAWRFEVGRAAFRTPFLFGGSAARAGLSCNSCHRDGRDNPDFHLEGFSGEPGTADVTSSIFSKVREDGVFNPVKIPTLVDAAKKNSFGSASPHGSLHAFIASAVDEEFAGAPPPFVVAAISDYVGHFDGASCLAFADKTTLYVAMLDARRALLAAETALQKNDVETADFLFAAARGQLGRVHERMPGKRLAKERGALVGLSGAIGEVRTLARSDAAKGLAKMAALHERFDDTLGFVHKARKKTLYEPGELKRWLGGRE